MTTDEIRDFCEQALEITDQLGAPKGLSFLIGEKFCEKSSELVKLRNKIKFLYADDKPGKDHPLTLGGQVFKVSYALTLNDHYKETLEQIDALEASLDEFIREIKSSFDINDIQDYLDSYPRLGFRERAIYKEDAGAQKESPMSGEDVISEVEDILMVEQLKKMFLGMTEDTSR